MYKDKFTSTRKLGLGLMLLLIMATLLSACGGAPTDDTAMSEQVPARRGNADILLEVQDITSEILDVPFDDVVEDADFRKDLGANEAQMAELGDVFAEAFTIELTDAEITALTTVESAVALIESKQQ
jgi:acyl carrier protein